MNENNVEFVNYLAGLKAGVIQCSCGVYYPVTQDCPNCKGLGEGK